MSINYLTLKNELKNDPLNLGYSGHVAIGDDIGTSKIVNTIGSGVGFSVFRNDIQPGEVINAIVSGDFINLQTNQLLKLELLLSPGIVDATQANLRVNFAGIFSGTATISGVTAVASRQGSRGEVLFGTGTNVSPTDVSQALRFTSG